MNITLKIGNTVFDKQGELLGTIAKVIDTNPDAEFWYLVNDCGNFNGYPLSELSADLFEHTESLPTEVTDILEEFCDGDNSYENCGELQKRLEQVGYTCDWGLDAEPYHLHKINLVV